VSRWELLTEEQKRLFDRPKGDVMSRFRGSRIAMLIDAALLPLGILKGILIGGVPSVYQELREWPNYFFREWRNRGWISESKPH
jgi:hypothetical protein